MEMLVDIAIPVVVIMMMFVVGLELGLEDFRRIQGYPLPVLVGTAGQLLILPIIAVVLALVLDPPRHIVAGMVLVAACPGVAISNYYVYLARANVALSVTLTAVTTVLAFVTLPVLTALGFKLLLDQQTIVNYQNTVLTAYQEVEDAMVGFIQAREESGIRAEGAHAAKRSTELSNIQYREGSVDFQRVIDSERALVLVQDQWTQARGDISLNLIAMYKALGGGWELREGHNFISGKNRKSMEERTDWGDLLQAE